MKSQSSKNQVEQWNPNTSLELIGLPFFDLILDEVLGILPQKFRGVEDKNFPKNLGELAIASTLPFEKLVYKLRRIAMLVEGIYAEQPDDLKKTATVWLGLNPPENHPWLLLVSKDPDLEGFLKSLEGYDVIFCEAENPKLAFSAAMYLREHGIMHVFLRH